MAQGLKKGTVIQDDKGLWFIRTQEGGRVALPEHNRPLVIKQDGMGMVRFLSQLDERRQAVRRHGMVVLYRVKQHGGKRWIKCWGVCPLELVDHQRIILLSNKKSLSRGRYGSRQLRRAS